jgi:copper resistance protein C
VASVIQPENMFMHRAALFLCTLLLCFTPAAWGHAVLLDGSPAANQLVNGQSVAVTLHFNSRIDTARSRLSLMGPDGRERILVIEEQPSPNTLVAKPEHLNPGSYILRWQVLSEDGHITRGEVPFRAQ